jgi:hypothetical protein
MTRLTGTPNNQDWAQCLSNFLFDQHCEVSQDEVDIPLKCLLMAVISYQHIRLELDTAFQTGMWCSWLG